MTGPSETAQPFRVWSTAWSGMTRYDGYFDVVATDRDDAIGRAHRKARQQGMNISRVERVEPR